MTDEKKTEIVLVQFPPIKTLRNISAFCLKVETWLRINNIPYENRLNMKARSKYGLLPYILLNGEEIADSQLILLRLKQHFKIEDDLTDYEKGVARAVDRMIEQHTFLCIYKYKMMEDPTRFVRQIPLEGQCPELLKPLFAKLLARKLGKSITNRIHAGLGKFTDLEFQLLLRQDFTAIKNILGNKPFMFGDKMTSLDCTVFSHISGIYFMPERTMVHDILDNEFPELIEYAKKIRDLVFPNDFTY